MAYFGNGNFCTERGLEKSEVSEREFPMALMYGRAIYCVSYHIFKKLFMLVTRYDAGVLSCHDDCNHGC